MLVIVSTNSKNIRHGSKAFNDCANFLEGWKEDMQLDYRKRAQTEQSCQRQLQKAEHHTIAHTSGSGHIGSNSLATSAGFMTWILTSWATRILLPILVCPWISKVSKAWSVFFASFITISSVLNEDPEDAEVDADLRAPSNASEARATVISLLAFDWIR